MRNQANPTMSTSCSIDGRAVRTRSNADFVLLSESSAPGGSPRSSDRLQVSLVTNTSYRGSWVGRGESRIHIDSVIQPSTVRTLSPNAQQQEGNNDLFDRGNPRWRPASSGKRQRKDNIIMAIDSALSIIEGSKDNCADFLPECITILQ